ncbi:hypothetical protein HK103_000781 [Boothiomyces macroporosus]|uniref:Thioredoxin domain-containing protein n=1 Tax=Boothiomyces macroporosus TaxID=261099 RepID=A0AAD5Y5Q2_9FUNG|nr:hypothetical protein HK103_000781 [Boothiomyces macroporosus]
MSWQDIKNPEEFHSITKEKFSLCLFYCFAYNSDVKSMPQRLVSQGVTCIQVDTNRMKDVAAKFRITGYPSFQFFVKGRVFGGLLADPLKVPEVLKECILAQSKYREAKSVSEFLSFIAFDGLSVCLIYSTRHPNHMNTVYNMNCYSKDYPSVQFCGIDEALGIETPFALPTNELQLLEKLSIFEKSGIEGLVPPEIRTSKKAQSNESCVSQQKTEKIKPRVSQSQTSIEKQSPRISEHRTSVSTNPIQRKESIVKRRTSLGVNKPTPIDTSDATVYSMGGGRKSAGSHGIQSPLTLKSDTSSIESSPKVNGKRRSTLESGSGSLLPLKSEVRPKAKANPASISLKEVIGFEIPEDSVFESKRSSVFVTPAVQDSSKAVDILVQNAIKRSEKLVLADDGYSIVEQIDAISESNLIDGFNAIREEQIEEAFFIEPPLTDEYDALPVKGFRESINLKEFLPVKDTRSRSNSKVGSTRSCRNEEYRSELERQLQEMNWDTENVERNQKNGMNI